MKRFLRFCARAFDEKHRRETLALSGFVALVITLALIGFFYSQAKGTAVPAVGFASRPGAVTLKPAPPAIGSWASPSEIKLEHTELKAGVSFSYSDLLATIQGHQVQTAVLNTVTGAASVRLRNHYSYSTTFPPADSSQLGAQLTAAGAYVNYTSSTGGGSGIGSFIETLIIIFVLAGVILFILSKHKSPMSNHTRHPGKTVIVPTERFSDVAGCDEAVEELREMVDFILHGERYKSLGARAPKGVILYGDPGVGKTLLAKAVAGESGVPFYATSGSDFVEMFVGVGAARIRNLFAQARKTGGVVFIDEVDAVARVRGSGIGGSSEDDRALNQLLVELDGFIKLDNVIVIAATNRLDVLDPALLRPGRLGRHIHVGMPNEEGRLAILRVHARDKPLGEYVDLPSLAASTAGATGADLAEMLNEGACMAAREDAAAIEHTHLWEGFLRVIAGPRKASSMLAAGERETIAYHESGHILCAELCPSCDPTMHATINPRGQAAGFAVIGRSDHALSGEQQIHEQLIYILGGRAAEHTHRGELTSGAADDLKKANALARQAVQELGLSSLVGQIIHGPQGLSEDMRSQIDSEVRRLVEDAYRDAVAMVDAHRPQLQRLAQALLKAGDINRPEIIVAMEGSDPQPRRLQRPHTPSSSSQRRSSMPARRHLRENLRLPELSHLKESAVAFAWGVRARRRARKGLGDAA